MTHWRQALWVLQGTFAGGFAALGVLLGIFSLRIPLEGGGLVLTPLGLFGALFFLWLAVGCVYPRALRHLGDIANGIAVLFISW